MVPRDDIDYSSSDSIEGIQTGRIEEPLPPLTEDEAYGRI